MKRIFISVTGVILALMAMFISAVSAEWVYLLPAESVNGNFFIGLNGFVIELASDVTGRVEGNTADNPQTIFDGNSSYDSDTRYRWTNWAENNEGRGGSVTWTMYSDTVFAFNEIRIHHFCDSTGCYLPESIAFWYYTVEDNATEIQLIDVALTATTGTGATYTDSLNLVTVSKNWSNPSRSGSYPNSGGVFQVYLNGSTKATSFVYSYTGEVPYTSFTLKDSNATVTSSMFKLTLNALNDEYVGLVELEFYLNGTKLDMNNLTAV